MKLMAHFPTLGIGTAVLANFVVYLRYIEGALGFVSLSFSVVGGFFTALVAYRQWRRGLKLEEHDRRLDKLEEEIK